jgi:hypothetical protein
MPPLCCAAAVTFVLWAVPMGVLGCGDALINLVAVSVRCVGVL